MADRVQHIMERMVGELEDLQSRGIFDADEVRSIVRKRREFEYRMAAKNPVLVDFLSAITYEVNLNALRQKRKAARGIHESCKSDHGSHSRVIDIFKRALRKKRGDTALWLQFIDYLTRTRSTKVLGNVYSQVLQLHPRRTGFWIRAASYEFTENQNMTAARQLLQRALRVNRTSRSLWVEYLRMELLYIARLVGRRMVLGLYQEDEAKRRRMRIDLGRVGGDGEADAADADEEAESELQDLERRRAIISGAIPTVVLRSALQAIPDDLQFRMDLLAVCDAVLLDATRVRSTMARKRRKTGRRRRLAAAAAAAREGQDGADGAPARAIGAIEGLDYPSTEDGATAATAEEEEEDGEEGSSDDAEEEGEDAGQDGGDAAWGDGLQVPPEAAGRPAAAEEAASSVAEAITQSLLEDFSHSAHAWTHAATRPMQRVLATAVASDRAAPSLPAAPLSATLPTPVDADARALSEEGRALEAGNVNSSDAALADARRVLVDAQAWGPALERVAAQRTAEGTLGDLAAGLPDPSVLLDAAQSGHALLASACRAFGSGAAWLAAVRFAVLCARVEPAGGDAAVAASGDGAWRKAVEVADAAMNHAPARLRYVAGLAAQARGASRRGAEGTGSDGRLDVLRALEHAREEEARCWAEVACLYTGLLRAGGVDEGVMRAAVARVTDLPHLGGQAARVWAAAVDSEALTAAARKAARSGEAGPEPSRKRQRVAGRAGEGRNRDSQSSGEEEEEEEESEEAGAAARCARDAARKLEGEGRARLLMREASLRAAEAAPAREVAASFEKAAVAASGKGVVAVHEAWASWALAQGSGEVAAVRQLVDRLLALPMPDTTHGRHALFRACLRVERASPAPSTKRVRRIFERAAQALGRSDAELWLEFMAFEQEHGDVGRGNAVHRRAIRTLTDPSSFIEAVTLQGSST